MNARFVPLVLILALLLAVGAIVVACGGGGGEPLTLGEYFQRFEALSSSADEALEELETESDEKEAEAASEEEGLAVFGDFISAAAPVIEEFISDLQDLNPPAEVEDAHNEALDAFDDFLAATENIVDGFESVESESDFDDLLEESGFTAAAARLDAVCLALEDIAAENSIDVDLDCDDV